MINLTLTLMIQDHRKLTIPVHNPYWLSVHMLVCHQVGISYIVGASLLWRMIHNIHGTLQHFLSTLKSLVV